MTGEGRQLPDARTTTTPPAPPTPRAPTTAQDFPVHRLANGLTIVGQPMPRLVSVAVGFLLPAGARFEDGEEANAPSAEPCPAGISHFVEALGFQGTRHRDAHALTAAFEEIGARRDSSTEPEFTWYTATVLSRHLPAALELLVDVIRYPAFAPDEVPKVRGRILQAIAQQEDEPARKAMSLLRAAYFGDHPLGHPPLGTPETVAAITRDDLHAYWRARYTAGASIVAVAGRFDFDAVCRQIEELCADWAPGSARAPLPSLTLASCVRVAPKETSQQHIAMGLPGLPAGHPDIYVAAVLGLVFGGSMNSRLFAEVREKRGLAYSVSAGHVSMENAGMYRIYAGTTPDKADQTVAVIIDEARRLAEHGITAAELERARTKLKSSVVMAGESSAVRRRVIGASWWYERRVRTLDVVRRRIDEVDLDRVGALARTLALGQTVVITAVGPRPEEELVRRATEGS
jgi:predicted Zn-dependent peptidase